MVGSISEIAAARQKRLWGTIQRLEDDEIRKRIEASPRSAAERTIEEWHDLVEGLDTAMRAMRARRRIDARLHMDEFVGPLAS